MGLATRWLWLCLLRKGHQSTRPKLTTSPYQSPRLRASRPHPETVRKGCSSPASSWTFQPTMARLQERLRLDPGSAMGSDWIMMVVLDISAHLEYGKPEGILRRFALDPPPRPCTGMAPQDLPRQEPRSQIWRGRWTPPWTPPSRSASTR